MSSVLLSLARSNSIIYVVWLECLIVFIYWAFFYCVFFQNKPLNRQRFDLEKILCKNGSIKPSWSIRRNAMYHISEHSIINLRLQRHCSISPSRGRNPSLHAFFSSCGGGSVFRDSNYRAFWFPGLPPGEFPRGVQEPDSNTQVRELVQVQETGGQRVLGMPVEVRRGFRDQQAKMWPLVSQNMPGEMDRLLEHYLPTV